ncbi:MAG: Fe-S protein assembly co-chaperone HscB [Betaproteobacteria bacterium]|jgi:molecular chaperone HscB|nr:Fe-S protein assembly co-chaperone HscB [Betaproteobacteria bacterium]
MIDFSCNHFELFGLPQRYAIDEGALDSAYRGLQAEVHPDRFGGGSDAERRVAHQSSARVNEAYRTLKDPVERARYLLGLRGVDAMDQRDTKLSLAFLEAQLERRERAASAAESEDVAALDAIVAAIRAEQSARQGELAALLDGTGDPEPARVAVRELKFLAKVAEDVGAMLEAMES